MVKDLSKIRTRMTSRGSARLADPYPDLVSGGGLEPPRVSPYAPQTYASASSAIPTREYLVPKVGFEPTRALRPRRPEHRVSASSTTSALRTCVRVAGTAIILADGSASAKGHQGHPGESLPPASRGVIPVGGREATGSVPRPGGPPRRSVESRRRGWTAREKSPLRPDRPALPPRPLPHPADRRMTFTPSSSFSEL